MCYLYLSQKSMILLGKSCNFRSLKEGTVVQLGLKNALSADNTSRPSFVAAIVQLSRLLQDLFYISQKKECRQEQSKMNLRDMSVAVYIHFLTVNTQKCEYLKLI